TAFFPNALIPAKTTLYAIDTNPLAQPVLANVHTLQDIQVSTDGGQTWSAVSTLPSNFLGSQGNYDSAIYAPNATTVYVAGQSSVQVSLDGGKTWRDITVDGSKNAPHADFHAIGPGGNYILFGTDGGIWGLDTGTNTWNDLNGNLLSIAQLSGVGLSPS